MPRTLGTVALDWDHGALSTTAQVNYIHGYYQQLLPALTPADCERLVQTGVATGGMLPKLDAALPALRDNPAARIKIAPAGQPDAVLRALQPDVGTAFVTTHKSQPKR